MRRHPALPRLLPIAAACVLALLVAGCGGSPSGRSATTAKGAPAVTVDARAVKGVGTVLVTRTGYVLYVFAPDNHSTVTCDGVCAGTWPPLKIAAGAALRAGPGVKQSLLSSVTDPAGGRVVTYDGWPLYTYTGDVQPGQATGQNIDLNGGEWYVMRPSGQPLEPQP